VSNLINIAEAITAEAHKLFAAETKIIDSFLAHGHTVEVIGTSGNRMRLGTGVAVTARVTTTIDGEKIYLRGEVLCSPIQDWPAFWQSLTPAETAAALRAAPKVAGPWSTPHARTGYWVRRAAITSEVVAKVESEDGKDRYYASILDADSSGQTDSLWAAQAAADAALVAKGWVLL